MIDWSMDPWLVGWSIDWLTDWFIDAFFLWLTGCLISWLADWLSRWLSEWMVGCWLVGWLVGLLLVGQLIRPLVYFIYLYVILNCLIMVHSFDDVWFVDWLFGRLANWLIYWLIDLLILVGDRSLEIFVCPAFPPKPPNVSGFENIDKQVRP